VQTKAANEEYQKYGMGSFQKKYLTFYWNKNTKKKLMKNTAIFRR
jgi:hypothetical protein